MEEFCNSSMRWNDSIIRQILPNVHSCVEQFVIVWVPFLFLMLVSPLLVNHLRCRKSAPLPITGLLILRWNLSLLVAVTALCTALLAVLSMPHDSRLGEADVMAYCINSVAMVYIFLLTIMAGRRGLITSGVLFLSVVVYSFSEYVDMFGVARRFEAGTWLKVDVGYTLGFGLLVLLLIVHCFADKAVSPPSSVMPRDQNPCPESNASFFNKLFFSYFDKMAWTGWRRELKQGDLWSISDLDTVVNLRSVWNRYWKAQAQQFLDMRRQKIRQGHQMVETDEEVTFLTKRAKTKKRRRRAKKADKKLPSVAWALFRAFRGKFIFSLFLKTFADLLEFCKPQILRQLISYMENPALPMSSGIFYAVLLLVICIVYTLILHQYFHIMFRLSLHVRSILMGAVFEKALCLSNEARKTTTVGEVVNLMSVDVQRIVDVCPYILLLWSAPFEVVLALGFLWNVLGPSVFAGFGAMLVMVPINYFLSSRQRTCQVSQMKLKDSRMKMMNEILNGIRVIKLHAWELAFQAKILEIRKQELKVLRKAAIYGAMVSFTWTVAPFLVAVVSFATYVLVDSSHQLTPQITFVSLALFNLLRFPITMLPMLIVYIIQASVANNRLRKFLNSSEVEEYILRSSETNETAVRFENATFSWDTEKEDCTVLRELNLSFPSGQCVAIIGRVGAGKSSIISALLGEMQKISGTVLMNGTISYVSQQAWILNATVRDNVLFTRAYQPQFYQDVIEACALTTDIQEMADGDQTEIGEKGINLSGGQKQRLCLARAVYQDTDIYLLDDPLSAVDSRVGRHIFDKVIGSNGLLKNKTRIFVTNSLAFLKEVDLIVIMEHGKVKRVGSPVDLMEAEESIVEIFEEINAHDDAQKPADKQDDEAAEKSPKSGQESTDAASSDKEPPSSDQNSTSLIKKSGSAEKLVPGKRLIETETLETGRVKWNVYKMYLRSIGLLSIIAVFILYLVSGTFMVGSSVWLAQWSEDSSRKGNGSVPIDSTTRISVYAGLGFGQALATFIASFVLMISMVVSSTNLHESLLHNLLRVPLSFYETTPLGRVLNRTGKDIDIVDNTLPVSVRTWMNCVVQILATLVIILMNMQEFGAVILPLGAVYFAVQRFYVSSSRQLKRLESVSRSPIYSLFQEVIQGVSSIRAYKAQAHFRDSFDRLVDANLMTSYPMIVSNRWLATRLELIGNLLVFFAAMFAVISRDSGSLSAGMVGLAISYALSITQTLNWVVRMTSDLETNIVSVERINEYISVPTEAEWVKDFRPPSSWPDKGAVTFDQYSMRYRPTLDLALRNVSFEANGGEKIGIVGRTGAGKSSITLALFRIVEAVSGHIIIDDIDVSRLGLHDLRSRISIIPQDPVLFCGSIRMNIDPVGDKSDQEIWSALEYAHLKPFVSSLPDKLDHNVSEGGENLSLGQRQLICLSRALLRKSRILVLDEATAAVDHETDQLIQNTIRRCFATCTVLTIAHRLNTVVDSDRILVLGSGRVVDIDTPANLLSRPGGEFYLLAKEAKLV